MGLPERQSGGGKVTDDDGFDWRFVKRLLALDFLPSMRVIAASRRFFKWAVVLWWVYTVYIALFLRWDYQGSPELWHYVEGVTGEELLAAERLRPEIRDLTSPLNVDIFNASGGAVAFPVVERRDFPDWVYETSRVRAYAHAGELLLGRVGLWFLVTFGLLIPLRLRFAVWELKHLKGGVV